jgi:quercetin dioxygenase-like cupin family protein
MIKGALPIHSFTYDGARINVFHVNKGEGLPKHSHIYAHASFCTAGSCIIRKENKELVMDKTTQPVNLLQDSWHEIEALEDNTVFINVFADKHNG